MTLISIECDPKKILLLLLYCMSIRYRTEILSSILRTKTLFFPPTENRERPLFYRNVDVILLAEGVLISHRIELTPTC